MTILLAMLVGLALPGQDPSPPVEPVTPFTDVEVAAPPNQGAVTLECRVGRNGSLSDCVIISETPAGQGFGEAALEAARGTRLDRRAADQSGSGGKVRFTIRFRLAD